MEIAFTKVKLPYGWLGNMAPYPVMYNGIRWHTTEHLFQALRFNDENVIEMIKKERNAFKAKCMTKPYRGKYIVIPKSEQDVENMKLCVKLKIDQHPVLKQWLIDTGEDMVDDIIIEDATSRRGGNHQFWGAKKINGRWEGNNMLGKIWMEFRKEIIDDLA